MTVWRISCPLHPLRRQCPSLNLCRYECIGHQAQKGVASSRNIVLGVLACGSQCGLVGDRWCTAVTLDDVQVRQAGCGCLVPPWLVPPEFEPPYEGDPYSYGVYCTQVQKVGVAGLGRLSTTAFK